MKLLITQGCFDKPSLSSLQSKFDFVFHLDDLSLSTSPSPTEQKLNKVLQSCWVEARDIWVDYTASLQSGRRVQHREFLSLGQIQGLGVWHLTGLGKRDPEVRKEYFYLFVYSLFIQKLLKLEPDIDIHIASSSQPWIETLKINFSKTPVYNFSSYKDSIKRKVRFLWQSSASLLIFLFTKILFQYQGNVTQREKRHVFFLSLHPISWVASPKVDTKMDRHYSLSTQRGSTVGLEAFFLIYPWPSFKSLFRFRKYRKEVENFQNHLEQPYYFLSNWQWLDLFFSIKIVIKALWKSRLISDSAFELGGLKAGPLMRPLLSDNLKNGDTFRILMQNSALLDGLRRWSSDETKNILVTYFQLFPETRLLAHTLPPNWTLLTVQHAVEYRNKFSNYFLEEELINQALPKKYFLQGDLYTQIVSEYYPANQIRTIGSLKYDLYHDLYHKGQAQPSNQIQKKSSLKTLLIAPSLEDTPVILSFFKDLRLSSEWRVLFKPHPALPVSAYEPKIKASPQKIEISTTPIWDLMAEVDLVAFNYSSVGLEAAFWGIPSVRLSSKKIFEIFDEDPNIPCFYTPQDFAQFLDAPLALNPDETIRFYFHKFDGLCHRRLWNFILDEMNS